MSAPISHEYSMNKRLGALAMVLSATGMGLVGTFSRGATDGLLPEHKAVIGSFLAFGRMSFGVIGFLIIALATKKLSDVFHARITPAVVLGGISIGLSLGCYISSTLLTSIANAVFLIYTGPLFCTILARIFRKEKVSPLAAAFLSLVFIGMLMTIGIIGWENGRPTFGLDLSASSAEYPLKPLGDLLGLLSGVFYGLALFFYGYRKDMDSIVRGTWNFIWAVVATLAMSIVLRPWEGVSTFTGSNWAWGVGLFLVCGLFALGWLVVAGRNLPAVEMSTISYWECVVAIICGLLIFHESLDFVSGIGGLLIIIGGLAPIFVSSDPEPIVEAPAPEAHLTVEDGSGEHVASPTRTRV
ncbi:DMT family transporter [Actinomyces sp. B33]|uniref:DMT family transporter n=1 Tax=Actinomyces sp. B33 TaxID=2942131 RepID=UPI00233FB194|nr:DMT family transporter [Actinomyces sp. B33]MDC4233692.1 DMT family transporter [Actinomyces sp. B33]